MALNRVLTLVYSVRAETRTVSSDLTSAGNAMSGATRSLLFCTFFE